MACRPQWLLYGGGGPEGLHATCVCLTAEVGGGVLLCHVDREGACCCMGKMWSGSTPLACGPCGIQLEGPHAGTTGGPQLHQSWTALLQKILTPSLPASSSPLSPCSSLFSLLISQFLALFLYPAIRMAIRLLTDLPTNSTGTCITVILATFSS